MEWNKKKLIKMIQLPYRPKLLLAHSKSKCIEVTRSIFVRSTAEIIVRRVASEFDDVALLTSLHMGDYSMMYAACSTTELLWNKVRRIYSNENYNTINMNQCQSFM